MVRKAFKETEIGTIPENWSIISLKEACLKIGSGITPRGGDKVYKTEGTVLIRSQNVHNNLFIREGLVCIDEYTAREMDNVEVAEKDILLNITGDSVARCCTVPNDVLPARVNQHVSIIRTNGKYINPIFLRYYLTSPNMQNVMLSLAQSGGTRNALTKGMIEKFVVPKPAMEEQESIAKILLDLDAKIELNQEMNKTLEKMGQALFKHWFIDFEFPNEKGKPYKSSGSKMVDSELGEIPDGWRVGKLGDLVHVEIGGDWGQNERFEGSVQTICLRGIDLQSLKEKGYSSDAPQRWIKKSSLEKRSISDCDILIGASGLGPVGRSLYCSDSLQHLYEFPLTYSNFCKRLGAISSDYAVYLEKLLEDIYLSGDMQNYITGTSVPNLDINGLLNRQIIIPDEELVIKYSNYAKNRFRKLFNKENIILSRIRDSLLPKLMSGQI